MGASGVCKRFGPPCVARFGRRRFFGRGRHHGLAHARVPHQLAPHLPEKRRVRPPRRAPRPVLTAQQRRECPVRLHERPRRPAHWQRHAGKGARYVWRRFPGCRSRRGVWVQAQVQDSGAGGFRRGNLCQEVEGGEAEAVVAALLLLPAHVARRGCLLARRLGRPVRVAPRGLPGR